MKKHADNGQIQRYALDTKGDIVDIRASLDKGAQFFCPACHDLMIPKKGKIRAWHFAHKTQICSYESYLHSVAKILLANWYNESPSIILDMEAMEICEDYENCFFHDHAECSRPSRSQYDLKKYYPACGIERPYGGFIPDILCQHPKSPLFLEIFFSHDCSEQKIQSGQRIIELVIDSEEAIDKIVSSNFIREAENIKLYNFKRKESHRRGFKRTLSKYVLYKSGKSFVIQDNVDCRNYRSHKPSAIYEITASGDCDPILFFLVGKSMAHREGFLPKDCSIYFWLGGKIGARICKLYKKCGNPMRREDNDASQCRMFSPENELIDACIAMSEK